MKHCPMCKNYYSDQRKKVDVRELTELINRDIEPKEIAERLGVTLSTVYKYIDNLKARKVWRVK